MICLLTDFLFCYLLYLNWAGTDRKGGNVRDYGSDVAVSWSLFSGWRHIPEDLMLIHTYSAVPLPCRGAKDLDCVFPIWLTQRDRVLIHTCHAVLRTCRFATSQGHGTSRHVWTDNGRLSTACGPPAQLRFLPANTRSYTQVVFTVLISRKLNCSWVLPRKMPVVIDEEKLTVFVQKHGTDPIFSKYCRYFFLTLMTSSLVFPPVRWNVVT